MQPIPPSRHRGPYLPGIVAVTALLLWACGDSPSPGTPQLTERDSAGVRIVETALTEPVTYRMVPDDPLTIIGQIDGPPEYNFGIVIAGLLLADGRIAVADQMASTIRVFDGAGEYEATWGGPGDGPGEFRFMMQVTRYRGDSILVAEVAGSRLTILDSEGRQGRRFPLQVTCEAPAGSRAVGAACRLWGGDLERGTLVASYPPRVPDGVPRSRSEVALMLIDAEGLGATVVEAMVGGVYGGTGGSLPMMAPAVEHFTSQVSVAPGSGGFAAADGLSRAVRFHDADGRLRAIGRLAAPREPLAGWMRDTTRAYYEAIERERPGAAAIPLGWAFPDSLPTYGRLFQDEEGNAWGGSTFPRWFPQQSALDVFAPDGRYLGAVELPRRMSVLDVRSDRLLTLVRDELDVPYLHVYPLLPPE